MMDAEPIGRKLRDREAGLIRACEIASRSPSVRQIELEWEAIASGDETIEEPWDNGLV
jgi:hypothetical protein